MLLVSFFSQFIFLFLLIILFIITLKVTEWSVNEISKWLMEIGLPNIIKHIHMTSITGRHLLHIPEEEIIHKLGIKEDEEVRYGILL